jgi:hypothetical protein
MRTLLSLPKNGDILLDDPTPQRSYFSSTGAPDKNNQDAEEQALFITSITTKYEALNWRMNGSNQVKLSGPTRTAFVDPNLVEGGYSGPLYAIASTLLKVGSILLAENVTILPCSSQSSLTSLFLLISAGIELQAPSHLTTMVEVIRGYVAGTTKSNVVVDWVVSIGKAKPLPCAVSSAALPLAIEMAQFIKEFLRSDFFDQAPPALHRRGPPTRSDSSIERSASLTRLLGQIQGFKDFLSPSKTRELKQNPPPIQAPPPSSSTSNENGNVQALLVATTSSLDRDAEIITSYKGESPHVTQSLLIRCNAETGLIGEKVASVCMSTFDDLVAYVKHVASRHNACPICNHPISSLVGKEKMKHMKRCFKKLKIIRCKACDRNFTERKALFDHFVQKHAALWQQARKSDNGNPNLFNINQPLVKPREPEPDAWSTTLVSKPDDILKSLIPGSAIPLNTTPAPSGNVAVALSTPAKKKELPPLDTELDPKTLVLTVRCPFCEFVSVNDNTFLNHAIKAHKNCAICREPFLSHLSPQEIRKHVQACWRKLKAFKCPYCDRAGLQEAKFLQGHIELHHKDILNGGGAVDVPDSWEELEAVANIPKATAKKQPPKKKATPPRFPSAPASKTAKLPPPSKIAVPVSASSIPTSTSFVSPPTAQELEKEIIKNITKALSDLPVTNGHGTASTSSAGLLPSPLVSPSLSSSSSSTSGVQQKPAKVKNQFKPKKPKAPKPPKAKGAKAAPGGAANGANGGPNPKLTVPQTPKKPVGNPPPTRAAPKQ